MNTVQFPVQAQAIPPAMITPEVEVMRGYGGAGKDTGSPGQGKGDSVSSQNRVKPIGTSLLPYGLFRSIIYQ
jgi:hypothetical protein